MLKGNVASVWYALIMKGYYLPHLPSSIFTSEYLLEVMTREIFKKEGHITMHTFKKFIKKTDLYIKLKELIQIKWLKDLGFTVGNLQNKKY